MSRLLFSILVSTFLMSSLSKTSIARDSNEIDQKHIEQEIQAAFSALADAVRTLDTEKYFGFFDHDIYTALNADGSVTHSFDEFSASFIAQTNYVEAYKALDFHNIKITVVDLKTAILVNEYTAEVILQSGEILRAAGAGTQIWSKRTGSWKLIHVAGSAKPAS